MADQSTEDSNENHSSFLTSISKYYPKDGLDKYILSPIFSTGPESSWRIVFGQVNDSCRIWFYSNEQPKWSELAKLVYDNSIRSILSYNSIPVDYYFSLIRNQEGNRIGVSTFIGFKDKYRILPGLQLNTNLEVKYNITVSHDLNNWNQSYQLSQDFGNFLMKMIYKPTSPLKPAEKS